MIKKNIVKNSKMSNRISFRFDINYPGEVVCYSLFDLNADIKLLKACLTMLIDDSGGIFIKFEV